MTSHGPCPAIIPPSPHKSLPILTSPLAFFTALHLEHRWLEDYVLVFSSTSTAPQSPHLIIKAYDNGYNIVYHGLLATCAIPTAADVPNIRAVLFALEAIFHWVFWSFAQENNDYSLPPRATWDPLETSLGGGAKLAQPHAWES